MRWHTILAALAAILFLGTSIPVHAQEAKTPTFEKADKANDLIQKVAKCPGANCGANCQLKNWLNANVAKRKIIGKSDCFRYVGTDLLQPCKDAIAAIPDEFTCKKRKRPPRVADAGKTKKPDKKPDIKPADNGKVDNPDPPAVASANCLDAEKFETFKHALWDRVATREDVGNHTILINKLNNSVDELKARPSAPWGWIISLLILNLLLTAYLAWPRLGPTLKKLISPPRRKQ